MITRGYVAFHEKYHAISIRLSSQPRSSTSASPWAAPWRLQHVLCCVVLEPLILGTVMVIRDHLRIPSKAAVWNGRMANGCMFRPLCLNTIKSTARIGHLPLCWHYRNNITSSSSSSSRSMPLHHQTWGQGTRPPPAPFTGAT